MSNLNTTTPPPQIVTHQNKGRHYEFITSGISAPFKNTSLHRALALKSTSLTIENWYHADDHDALDTANLKAWAALNQADQAFGKLQNIYAFAEPLLKAKLKETYGIDEDVRSIFLRLYFPKKNPWYVIDTQLGYASRTVSLLDAALHNFALSETFTTDSDFISKPDINGHFDINPIKTTMSIDQFKKLCRELDVGARYNQYLRTFLVPREPVSQAVLEHKANHSQKAVLGAAAHMALLKKDISANAFDVVLGIIDGQTGLTLNGKVMQCSDLSMMDASLTGIVLFTAVAGQSRGTDRLIAYVPHDPEHPLKEYASALEFVQELTRQLRENRTIPSFGGNYRQFFSQFIDQQQRGHFFADLDQRLSVVQWHEKDRLDPGPTWRATPVDKPNLEFRVSPIDKNLWQHLYQQKVSKIINDAREIAVSTAKADDDARWVWWDNFKKMISDIFNAALLVLTPFVPGLGELMLAYTAYQLSTEVVEGVLDLIDGQWTELAEHVVGVVADVVQLAAFGAGAAIGNDFRLKLSPLVEGMKPVQVRDGTTRLWHPDLAPYEQKNLQLPDLSKPDALGLHQHAGKKILPLDGRYFEVRHDPDSGLHRVQHPSRTDAYAPKLRHNSRGAWVHEGENPQEWDSATLLRRIGYSTDGFSADQLEDIRQISGTDESSLRYMHAKNTAPPLLLEDTLKRQRAFNDIQTASADIRAGRPLDPSSYWFEQQVTDLPGWPSDSALRVYQQRDLQGPARTYGNPDASPDRTLNVSLGEVMAGKLPDRLTAFLNEAQLEQLLGANVPKEEQVQALRDRLAEQVERHSAGISDSTYRLREASQDPRVQQLQSQYPELPTAIAERLVAHTAKRELEALDNQQRLPLSLKTRAREYTFETQAVRACEGFYQKERLSPDTERLALNALFAQSDGYHDLRVDIRESTFEGPLRCSVGPAEAANVRILLRDVQGRYEIHDGHHRQLFKALDLYESLLRVIPEQTGREPGYVPGQGQALRKWLIVRTEAAQERRDWLLKPSIRPVPTQETVFMLHSFKWFRSPETLDQRVQALYPTLSERERINFINSLPLSNTERLQVVSRLNNDLQALRTQLNVWEHGFGNPSEGIAPPREILDVSERLMECFQRKPRSFGKTAIRYDGGYTLDLSSENRPINLRSGWSDLPKEMERYLKQITTLNLDNSILPSTPRVLLKDFAQLRQLSARNCSLNQVPDSIDQMRMLETLRLSGNDITLNDVSVMQISDLTRLQTLQLDHNPRLGQAPNVERMPRLKILDLAHTGIKEWPEGLLNKHRSRGFFLDLRGTGIDTVPDAVAKSKEAWLIARARINPDQLRVADREALFKYREAAGLPHKNSYAPLAANARAKWLMSNESRLWGKKVEGLGAYREEAWDNLINEPNSEGFFRIIDSLTESADYRTGGPTRLQLARRVWDLIDAMELNSQLRERLFNLAAEPTTCADASTEVFNIMGMQALVAQAYDYSISAAEVERKLVILAKGATRLERVNEIARKDSLSRASRAEEVEIYQAYQTALAPRLELPWQSDHMLHRGIADVSDEAIDEAYSTIITQEKGNGLIDGMLEQPFWETYLRENFASALEYNDQLFDRELNGLEDRRALMSMSEDDYSREIVDLAERRLDLSRNLTRAVLQKYDV
ncbi:NEL-type E3 ubiquitin ligase domain-containing protein [Pseudomonas sp. ZT5P21]